MLRISSLALLSSLAVAGACKSDDAGGSNAPQQPTATTAAAPAAPAEDVAPGGGGDNGQRGHQRMTVEERRAERLQKYDANHDGRLDRSERVVMRREAIDRRMTRLDANADGKVSRDEAGARRIGKHLIPDFNHADVNRDSFISREELERVLDERRAQRRAERQQQRQSGNQQPGMGPQYQRGTRPAPAEEDADDGMMDDEE